MSDSLHERCVAAGKREWLHQQFAREYGADVNLDQQFERAVAAVLAEVLCVAALDHGDLYVLADLDAALNVALAPLEALLDEQAAAIREWAEADADDPAKYYDGQAQDRLDAAEARLRELAALTREDNDGS